MQAFIHRQSHGGFFARFRPEYGVILFNSASRRLLGC
jgi:hypothetical protein